VKSAWIIVPLYNEAQVIHDVVTGLLEVFPNVVCVDDGSRDDSAAEAERAGAVVVRHSVNLGQGAAIQTGITFALRDPDARWFVTFDADGQHLVSDAVDMVARLRAGEAEMVFGSRFLDDRTRMGLIKGPVLKLAVAYSNSSTGVRLTDTHNGLRAFSRGMAERFDLRQNRMAHASEIIEQVGDAKVAYVEHPVHIQYTEYSRRKGQSLWNSVNILAEMLYR
jgi:polyprenyl-phospho-N-acetylgalactosaminyl synthase